MRKLMIIFGLLLIAELAMAAEYKFIYKYPYGSAKPIETLVIKQEGANKEEAFKEAASKCAKHFWSRFGTQGETGYDVIDTCANPR